MIKKPPEYFQHIRQKANERWQQLEADPDLAAPWYQLFRQVQSPRHVLSELLQNADDAGATEASVRLESGWFVFTHNGEDFTEEHFASLCRFGYSNKRTLHTIGFRGVGFKSVFSLGDSVELHTRTLSVAFNRDRFTLPRWLDSSPPDAHETLIRVEVADDHRMDEVTNSLEEWRQSPVSLLFFRNIRCLSIEGQLLQWQSLGSGPTPASERYRLSGDSDAEVLLFRSDEEPFSEEAVAEIRQERSLGVGDDKMNLPPCSIEVVLGEKGRLFAVLPTGVLTDIPFACNASFIQDPARLKIKDPETSPTNRWLLERMGRLAAESMLSWLQNTNLPLNDRAEAYSLLYVDVNWVSSLETSIKRQVRDALLRVIKEQPVLLTEDGNVVPAGDSVILPDVVLKAWSSGETATCFDSHRRPPLCRKVNTAARNKLISAGLVQSVDADAVIKVLLENQLPKPEMWEDLAAIWALIADGHEELSWYHSHRDRKILLKRLNIIPVEGSVVLYPAEVIVRLGREKLLKSDSDWDFLSRYILVMSHDWDEYIGKNLDRDDYDRWSIQPSVAKAGSLLWLLDLSHTSSVDRVMKFFVSEFLDQGGHTKCDYVRLAQIAACLGAKVEDSFPFLTRDGKVHRVSDDLLFDVDGSLEYLLPESVAARKLIDSCYTDSFTSCTQDQWRQWVQTGKSGLHTFPPLEEKRLRVWSRDEIVREASERGFQGELAYRFKTNDFIVSDWDFPPTYWQHWETLAADDDKLWVNVIRCILQQQEGFWRERETARIYHVATTLTEGAITTGPLTPQWIRKLRNLTCLPDTHGRPRMPAELLRRTSETEPMRDVESFVDPELDSERTRPLLDLLGVSSKPTGPDRILDRLRDLAKSDKPPKHEVCKWYRRLDQIAAACSTEHLAAIRNAFAEEQLLLSVDGPWLTSSEIFLSANENDVPGAPLVLADVRDLTLWGRVGVAERPTAELAIRWLVQLPSGEVVSQDKLGRVQSLLGRHPERIWRECGHWLNLEGQWVPVESLEYAQAKQREPQRHLFPWLREKTADLQSLSMEAAVEPPFSKFVRLDHCIRDILDSDSFDEGVSKNSAWMNQFGKMLTRIRLEDPSETERVRELGAMLSQSSHHVTWGLRTIPYIDGMPVGDASRVDVTFIDGVLYTNDLPTARLARVVPEYLTRLVNNPGLKDAVHYCFDRPPDQVTAYLEQNFDLEPVTATISHEADTEPFPTRDEETVTDSPETTGEKPSGPATEATAASGVSDGQPLPEDGTADVAPEGLGVPHTPRRDHQTEAQGVHKMMERFATHMGFSPDGDGRFYNSDGECIGLSESSKRLWERWSASGELIQAYWLNDHCLLRKPLEIEYEIWSLLTQRPELYSLILLDTQGQPIQWTGKQLLEMQNDQRIELYPATYRLSLKVKP